jgi:hypothetical protein
MAQHVELVEQDPGLGGVVGGRLPKWLPHVHDREPNPRGLAGTQPRVELVEPQLLLATSRLGEARQRRPT